jgi:hypothetical protein
MANDNKNRSQQCEPANTAENTSRTVPMHIGRNTVQVDPRALRHLIETLRARLYREPRVSH